jgi:hypothetical protein
MDLNLPVLQKAKMYVIGAGKRNTGQQAVSRQTESGVNEDQFVENALQLCRNSLFPSYGKSG